MKGINFRNIKDKVGMDVRMDNIKNRSVEGKKTSNSQVYRKV